MQVAVSGFIIALGVAVLAWYGIKKGERWALLAAFVVAVALPLHGIGTLGHLGLTYLDALQ